MIVLAAHKQLEVLFISHNPSMSDCLETIYLAAKADPNCTALWMPIPYYELDSRTQTATMVYKGADEYDASFDCVHWQTYDIKARHPDIIFTYNLYDDYNSITSVHPTFYNKYLWEMTNSLIYVPYFVDLHTALYENMALMPGCIFTGKTILATYEERNLYRKIFYRAYKNKFGLPKSKFVALGSPKYDKVLQATRAQYELPDQWQALIKDKKVITLISSVGSIMDFRIDYIIKLLRVFELFQVRDDVVLWWRPHPLAESTFKSIVPALLPAYQRIVRKYKEANWGIYDDTPQLHRAIAYSDGYYGEWSSLLLMFQLIDKPVMLSSVTSKLDELKVGLKNCHYESDTDPLSSYIDNIVNNSILLQGEKTTDNVVNADGTAGYKIYQYAKRTVLRRHV